LFFTLNNDASRSGLHMLNLRSGETTMVSPVLSRAEFAAGRLFFSRDGSLFSQPFDPVSGVLSGEPLRLVDDVGRSGGASRFNFAFSVANDGTLAYWSGTTMPQTQLTWLDRLGRQLRTVGGPEVYHGFDLSPDGTQGTVERMDPRTTNTDIRMIDMSRSSGAATPFINAPEGHVVNTPLWSPDGKWVLYAETANELFLRNVVSGERKPVPTDPGAKWPTSWSPNGEYIVMDRTSNVGEIWVLPVNGGGKAYPYVKATYSAQGAQVSPDGRWLAYRSDETGEYEIYIDSFPKPGRKVRVSVSGGSRPRWRSDGREIYFIGRDHRLMAVGVDPSGDRAVVKDPQALFQAPNLNLSFQRTQYIASPDGQQFLFNAQVADPALGGISIGVGVVSPPVR
jgi:Tol biopolymer transport system component